MTTYFSDGFESGNTSAWTSTVDSANITRTITALAARDGSYGMRNTIAGAGNSTVRKTNLGADVNPCYARFYIRFVTGFAMTSGDTWVLTEAYNASWSSAFRVVLYKSGSTHYMWTTSYTNSGSNIIPGYQTSGWVCDSIIDNNWHYIEVYKYAHASAGETTFWVDGTQRGAATGQASDTKGSRLFELGTSEMDAGTSGSVDQDCFIVADTYNGPLSESAYIQLIWTR